MCTVSYLPLGGNDFILTSNRDENPKRETLPPKEYNEDGISLIYPKDKLAGGTWIGLSENNRLICLLNGGYENHERAASYRASRGVIVKQLLKADNAVTMIEQFDLNGIEPFTIVLVDWNDNLNAYELVWTGKEKNFRKLEEKPHIWSSSTLYTEEMKQLRRDWFANWLKDKKAYEQSEIISFHLDDTKEAHVSPKMKREFVETVSVTSVKKEEEQVSLQYHDVLNDLLTRTNQNRAKADKPTNNAPMIAKNI
ncbi:NRDE family protein [Tenacibaculum amylolyticum]|uniref:NRDE family protein n=1 Tax=Tenacibaculum amylolyticum TaxID=104269 RepID=UPI00389475E3